VRTIAEADAASGHVGPPTEIAPSGSAAGTYRPALDGIRAIAVIAVVGYHVGWLRGGFLGVDVFFVLSGYLITTLLLRELNRTGRIDLGQFWARRARRLFPAVLFLLTVCVAEVAHSGAIATYSARRADIVSTLFYYANWHFIATDQSYFAAYAGVSPLRHMWSLAIEEQFYLVWPLLVSGVFLVHQRRAALLFTILGAGLASVIAMAYEFDRTDPSRAYFGTDTRVHVLLAGAAFSVVLVRHPSLLANRVLRRVDRWGAPVVVGLVGIAFALLSDQSPFYYRGGSLLFAIATVLLLFSVELRPHAALARVLSAQPLRWIGQLSYSLYLWHWPIIVWLDRLRPIQSTFGRRILEIGATLVLASFSYYVIERPVRYGQVPWLRLSKRRLAVAALVSALAVCGATIAATNAPSLDNAQTDCAPGSPGLGTFTWCVRVSPTALNAPVIVAVGDSTSLALDPGLRSVASARAWRYVQAGHGGCSVLPLQFPQPVDSTGIARAQVCSMSAPAVIKRVTAMYKPSVWVISDRVPLRPLRERTGQILSDADPRHNAEIARVLRTTIRRLVAADAQVVLVGAAPAGAPAECGARTTGACGGKAYSASDRGTRELNLMYRDLAREMPGSVAFVPVADVLCRGGHCPATIDGVLARWDGIHLTTAFSRRLVPIIVQRAEHAGIRFNVRHKPLAAQIADPHRGGG
jgi:peptidoglycan/LPS O-acetylase OafA/YrhL